MKKEVMKRPYISPSAKTVAYCPFHFCQKSNAETEWHTGTDGKPDDTPVGPQQPDPNSDDSRYMRRGMWDEME